jgi:phi LC3 family holin
MKINWLVRIKNEWFWITIIPMFMLLIQAVAALFGYTLDLTELGDKILDIVNIIFGILATLGIVVDNTTKGVSDSEQALTYTEPKKSNEIGE